MKSLQDQYAPNNECFGCGPANKKGLRIKSFVEKDQLVAHWQPESHHIAFKGMLNGGICGALLDCHSNWTAAYFLMLKNELKVPPCTVTAEYKIQLHRPTPSEKQLKLVAWVVDISPRKGVIKAYIEVDKQKTASCEGTFVAVQEGHPAYNRW